MPKSIPIACSLDQAGLADRACSIAALGERLLAVETRGPRATLEFEPGAAAAVAEFVAEESRCCPFFEFEQDANPRSVRLAIGVPEDGKGALRSIVAGFLAGGKPLA